MPYAFPGQAIITSGGRRVVAGGASVVARTYADFQAHIATLATNGVADWGGNAFRPNSGSYRTAPATTGGFIFGSPWLSIISPNWSAARLVQHSMPNQTVFDLIVAAQTEAFFRVVYAADAVLSYTSTTRNGYTSEGLANDGNPKASVTVTELIYWDGAQAQRMQPSLGLGPTPYTW